MSQEQRDATSNRSKDRTCARCNDDCHARVIRLERALAEANYRIGVLSSPSGGVLVLEAELSVRPVPSVTDADLRSMGDMILLCGEDECRDVKGYAPKLRALIDGLIEAKQTTRSETPRIQDSWKLVPIKPTEEMRVAGNNTGEFEYDYPRDSRRAADHVWRVMVETAPSFIPLLPQSNATRVDRNPCIDAALLMAETTPSARGTSVAMVDALNQWRDKWVEEFPTAAIVEFDRIVP